MPSTITRWNPLGELDDLRHRVERMLDDAGNGKDRDWRMPVDIVERDDGYVLRASIPGMTPDDVSIEVEDDVLTVSAHHEETEEDKKDNYVRRERRSGFFTRSVTLPKGVKADDVGAVCKDGVLEVSFPKPAEPEATAVKITPKPA